MWRWPPARPGFTFPEGRPPRGRPREDRRAEFEPNGPSPFKEAVAFALQYRLTLNAGS